MDRQHAAAEPEQRDEYATEWAHRELNTMPIAVTQTNTPQAMLPIDGRDTLNSFPTSANPRDISHSTSWMTFQPYQQRAGFIGCDHGQGSGLPEEVQQELAEAELRHTVARYEILEKAKAFSPSSHSRIIDAPYMDPVIGSTITDYGGESGPSNALMHSHQLFNHGPMPNDSDSMRDFNLGVWPTQQIPDTAFDLNPSQNGVHDPNQMSITLPNIHVDDPSAPYQAMYREPFTETSLLPRTPPYNRMISILDTGDHGNNCETSIDGLCLRCKDILNKNAYRTPVQKFTCDIRTRFADFAYSCFTNVPEVSDPTRSLLKSDFAIKTFGFTLPTTVDNIKRIHGAMFSMMCELVERLRNFLDFMEPLHVRQFITLSSLPVLWSYSSSIIKWQKIIGSLWPSLKDDLHFHKEYHIHRLRPISLHLLDHMEYFGDYCAVALMLNVWYEEISAMDKNLITSSSVKDHLQSSLADRILHIYRSLFPTSTAGKTLRTKGFESPALALSLFHSTTGLLPSHYRQLSMGDIAWNLLLRQKTSIRSDENLSSEKADPHCQKPPEHSFPALKAYVPAQLLAMLGLDTETQDFSANSKWMEPVEVCILKQLANYDAKVQKEILGLSPYTLSVGTKALFDKVNRIFAEEGLVHQDFPSWDCGGRALLPEIVNMSVRYGTMLIASLEFWSSLHEREVTLAEFVMENRDLEDKYFHVLARDPESTKIYAMSVVLDWACSLGWRVDMEVAEKIVAKMLSVIG
ncbi:unnamed protein product [Alternaria alternata]